jgi:hypothetical protein
LRTKDGRIWASRAVRTADELVKVDSMMRCEAEGAWQACLRRPGRKREAIVEGGMADAMRGEREEAVVVLKRKRDWKLVVFAHDGWVGSCLTRGVESRAL